MTWSNGGSGHGRVWIVWALTLLFYCQLTAQNATRPETSTSKPGATRVNTKDGLSYVWIPAGKFLMGCYQKPGAHPELHGGAECDPEEQPAHEVIITKGFWMGQTEVTGAAYERLMGPNRGRYKGEHFPAEVKWNDAESYCEKAGGRLPTEAEWEYAARGNAPGRASLIEEVAWSSWNSKAMVHEVGLKQANGYGVYDMLGNVWEWTADWHGRYSGGKQQDPQGPPAGQGKVFRGGSYADPPGVVSVSFRSWGQVDDHYGNGFRCVSN